MITRRALSSHCSFVDAPVFQTSDVSIGRFRCPVDYPSFRDTGPIERCLVVFPRSAVWIRHEGRRAFLADPSVATIYNAAQRYERFPESPDGDRCDWFGVSDEVAREVVSDFDLDAASGDRPFRFEWAASPTPLYLRQRGLLRRAAAGQLDALEGEEEVIAIVTSVMAVAYRTTRHLTPTMRAAVRHSDLVDAARTELLRSLRSNTSVSDIARAIGTSPYHLCRRFSACTGRTLHQYRTELRLRLAVEHLEDPAAGNNLSAIAHDLGFCSHSHFVRVMRRCAGMTPSAVRDFLTTGVNARTSAPSNVR
ncbi:MAG TPA: AraC family transcriptional regulator [Gemmatimonadaceae bacterium]|nr:AraC family transcriptional regulator [Gemmatimonadaceae bacterium]